MSRRKRGLGRVRMKQMEEIRELMTEMVGQDFIKDKWSRETSEGYQGWLYLRSIIDPYLQWLGRHPDLTPEQRQVAVKTFWKKLITEKGLEMFLASVARACYDYAKGLVMTVAEREKSPPAPPSASLFLV